jgi:predicted nucleic acid-binding protein
MVANEARASVVCDAGPLIHLDEMGCLDLLADFEQVLAPDVVWDEVTRHRPDILQSTDLRIMQVPTPLNKDSDGVGSHPSCGRRGR